jgi:hypothetical protein
MACQHLRQLEDEMFAAGHQETFQCTTIRGS